MKRFLALVLLSGCATQYQPIVQDLNKDKGQMSIAYEYGGIQWQGIDWSSAEKKALEQCIIWGFNRVIESGIERSECMTASSAEEGCARQKIIQRYQCLK